MDRRPVTRVIACVCYPLRVGKRARAKQRRILKELEHVEPFSRAWGRLVCPQLIPDHLKQTWGVTE